MDIRSATVKMICTPKVRQTFGGAYFYEKRRKPQKKYSPEFKISVILDMRENHLGYNETIRKYGIGNGVSGGSRDILCKWERKYLEEGEAGFYIERRGRTTKMENPMKGRGKKKPLDKKVENDLIAENQRVREEVEYLRAENKYIKKLSVLIAAEEQKKSKKQK